MMIGGPRLSAVKRGRETVWARAVVGPSRWVGQSGGKERRGQARACGLCWLAAHAEVEEEEEWAVVAVQERMKERMSLEATFLL